MLAAYTKPRRVAKAVDDTPGHPSAGGMIVVFGSINLDLIFSLPTLPQPGETLLSPAVRIEPGGKGANQAVAAARDGASVIMAGAVGPDALADAALAVLRQAGVDLSRVGTSSTSTGCAGIFVDPSGRNVIGVGSGANLAARADQVEDAALCPQTTLLLQMEVPVPETEALIRRARGNGARIVLNLAPVGAIARESLSRLDVLVVNETEAASLAGQLGCGATAADLHRSLGIAVVRSLGEQGLEAVWPGGSVNLPAHPVSAVDTTAAGDCLTGVLAGALDRGMDMNRALWRANIAAALCCTRAGSQATMPTAQEIDQASQLPPGAA